MHKYIILVLGFLLVGAVGVFLIRSTATGSSDPSTYQVRMVSKEHAAFEGNRIVHEAGLPYIQEAVVAQQSGTRMAVDLIYVVPKKTSKLYTISVIPNAGGFTSSDNTLKPYGKHRMRVHMHFSPSSIFKRGIKSTELHFSIRERLRKPREDREIGPKIYERYVPYEKNWRKKKPNPLNVGPAGFIVNGKDKLR